MRADLSGGQGQLHMRDYTMPELVKGQRVTEAFQRVLDDPAADEALAHPALKPLLEEAAD